MDELVERVARALAAEYSGAPNGRVRDLPDRRAIRWYTTTGLVDRPLGMRGRTALYGRRHLLQLVAVKRRQAQGHTLAAIQAELHGADDAVLAEVARVPEEVLAGNGTAPDPGPARPRFWAVPAVSPQTTATAAEATDDVAAVSATGAAATTAQAAAATTAQATAATAAQAAAATAAQAAAATTAQAAAAAAAGGPEATSPLGALRLRGGAILVVPGVPDADDRAAIAAAAEPLLALLADRGLLKFDDGSPS
jgi:DNA-binding transcriptional MerR regulator